MAALFEQLTHPGQLRHLESVARRALAYWALPQDAGLRLLSLSENATYEVVSNGLRRVMRVHRTAYHSEAAVRSELAWMHALQLDAGIKTPQALAGIDGGHIATIQTADLHELRMVCLFEWIDGDAPDESRLHAPFRRLGEVTAQLHQHARQWSLPEGFERLRWDFEGCLGTTMHWGDWRAAPGLDSEMVRLIDAAVALLKCRLDAFGTDASRFGLIHADLRLANLLEVDGETRVIDFDDAGFGWFLYDLAGAVSFIETRDDLSELVACWLAGYRRIAPVRAEEEAMIPSFILLRRLTLMAWIGSHAETALAQEQGVDFTLGSVMLAKRFIDAGGTQL